MKNNRMMLFFLIIIIGITAYLDSPYSFLNENYYYSYSEPAAVPSMSTIVPADNSETEDKLVIATKVGGYLVETYREYDVYKDAEGNIIKEVPTSHYDELKYWDYNSKKK